MTEISVICNRHRERQNPGRLFFCRKIESRMKDKLNGPGKTVERPKNTPARMRKITHENLIVDLFLQGHSQEMIRDEMESRTGHKYSTNFIGKAVSAAMKEWEGVKAVLIDNHKAVELAKINNLETTYWDAWHRSTGIIISTSKVKRRSNSERLDKRAKLELLSQKEDGKQTAGDPRFLTGVQWCIDKRCEILGIDAPAPAPGIQITNNVGTTIMRKVVFLTRETTTAPQIITEI